MGVVFQRLLQTIKLQRDAFVWMDFNDRATGDAAILVAVTQVLIMLGTGSSIVDVLFNPARLVSALISALFFWLIYTGATYVIVRYLLDGEDHSFDAFPILDSAAELISAHHREWIDLVVVQFQVWIGRMMRAQGHQAGRLFLNR